MVISGANEYVEVSRLGRAFLPSRFADAGSDCPIRCFSADNSSRNQAMRFLKRGGAIVLSGEWADIKIIYQEILKREDELLPRVKSARERTYSSRNLRNRILTTIEFVPFGENDIAKIELAGFLGEENLPDSVEVLVSVQEAEQILEIPGNEQWVKAINANVVAHPDVLLPQSQETIDIIYEAIKSCGDNLQDSPRILDMGCGSGVLGIAAYQLFCERNAAIMATDILPEAAASAHLNWRRLVGGEKCADGVFQACSGNLFDPVKGQKFDIIIFNAPWIVAPAKNKSELALNDDSQNTIRAFVESCIDHLSPNGRVVVCYSDNSGQKAIDRLEEYYSSVGLEIERVYKDRVHTRRARNQWQNMYAYVVKSAV